MAPFARGHEVAMIAFGPIPSRRLGHSLGVNHIPRKHCTYSCTYCQVGPTLRTEMTRCRFRSGEEVVRAVAHKVAECWRKGHPIDCISFVPDGEPTLDSQLGLEILGVKTLGLPVAVFTNGSLLWRRDVRNDLDAADLVSVKVDTVEERAWRRLDRPPPGLALDDVLDGVLEFSRSYPGKLVTETMLVRGVNDDRESLERLAIFLEQLAPRTAYLALPTRPPADPRVRPPSRRVQELARTILEERVADVELLASEEPGPYTATSDPVEDLLAILAVHPMRMPEVEAFLTDSGLGRDVVERLVEDGRAEVVRHRRQTFLVSPRSGISTPRRR